MESRRWKAFLRMNGETIVDSSQDILTEFKAMVEYLKCIGVNYSMVVQVEAGQEERSRTLAMEQPPSERGREPYEQIAMAKFIMSIGDNAYDILSNEAKNRDVTVQQLLRAVVVPDWIRQNADEQNLRENRSLSLQPSVYRTDSSSSSMLVSPVARLRR